MPPNNRSFFATYGGQRVTPYAGEAQPSPAEAQQRMALGGTLARSQPSPYGAATPMSGEAPAGGGSWIDRMTAAARAKKSDEQNLQAAAGSAGNFADQGQAGYGQMTEEMAKQRAFFNDMMNGRNSVATEQLRQGLQQQQAAQMSMAAGASPQNSAMAARTAMTQTGRNQSAMSGQAAVAQLQERQMAADQLAKLNMGQRGQDIEVGLGSRQNQMTGLGVNKADAPKGPSKWEKLAAIGGTAAMFSDERLKENIKDGDKAARQVLSKLSAKTYDYKDQRHGKGPQLGFMAQDLERAGAKSAVIETPIGKAIDTSRLTGINTGLIASLAKRLDRVEKRK